MEHDRDGCGCSLRGQRGRAVGRDEYCDRALDKFDCQSRQFFIPAFRIPVVDYDILPNYEACVLQRLEKWYAERGFRIGRAAAEITDHGDCLLLLRAPLERPGRSRTADKGDEFTSFQAIKTHPLPSGRDHSGSISKWLRSVSS